MRRRRRLRACCRAEAVATPAALMVDRLAHSSTADGRVTMLCGSGCQGAHDEVLALADRLKSSYRACVPGKEHVEWTTRLMSA